MKRHPIETLVPDVVRVSAGHIHQFLSGQSYSQTEDLRFFHQQLDQIQRGSMDPNFIPRFTSLLSHLSQAPIVTGNQILSQHFLVLKRHLSVAITTTVPIGQESRQGHSFPTGNSISTPATPVPLSNSSAPLASSASMLGKYQVVEKIGEGGNGVVFLGINPVSQQRVALKCLTNLQSQDLIDAVREEARVAARINHPNCVKVRDMVVDASRGSPVIVSDFIDGVNGRDFLEDPFLHKFPANVLPPRAALLMIEQMIKGVRAAHKTGIVHRDIKPENFLVTKEALGELRSLSAKAGPNEAVVQALENRRDDAWILLSDWGLALEKKGISLTTSKTFDLGTIPLNKQGGTLVYMPIEQIEGSNIGRKSDVFALGLVLYELLTGASALEARSFAEGVSNDPNMTAQAFLVAVASSNARFSIDPGRDPHLRRLAKNKDLMNLLQAMTARDRNERLSSAALEAAIQDLLSGKKLHLSLTRSGRPPLPSAPAKTEEAESSQAILFLQGLAIGLVLLLVSILGYALFSKSESPEVDEKTAIAERADEQAEGGEKPTTVKQDVKVSTKADPDPKPEPPTDPKLEKPPVDQPVEPVKPVATPKPLPDKNEGFEEFREKYKSQINQQAPLLVKAKSLTPRQAKFLTQYRGRTLVLFIATLDPEIAGLLSQSPSDSMAFPELRSLSPEALKNMSEYRGSKLIFAELDTLSLSSAPYLAGLKVNEIVFKEFKTTPDAETIATVRTNLFASRSRLRVKWPKATALFISQNMAEISKFLDSKSKKESSRKSPSGPSQRPPNGSGSRRPPTGTSQNRPRGPGQSQKAPGQPPLRSPPEHPRSANSNAAIWAQIKKGELANIGQLTSFAPGIPSLIMRFAERQQLKTINLSQIQSLLPPYASQLAKFKGRLILSGLTDVESTAKFLSRFSGDILDLSGLRSISKEALGHLSQLKSTLVLGPRSPKMESLKILAAGQLRGLILKNLETLEIDQAECLSKSGIAYLNLGLERLSSAILDSFKDYQGIIEFQRLTMLAPEWISSLKKCRAKKIRFTGLKHFPENTVRVLRNCSAAEAAILRKSLLVPKSFQKKLAVALR